MTARPARRPRSAREGRRAEGRPKPFWRVVGYFLYATGWSLVAAGTVALLAFVVVVVARGDVGPFSGNPIGGMIVLVVLGGPFVGWLFFLSPLVSVSQALLGFSFFRASIGMLDDDPPVAINNGRRIPVYAPAVPTPFTRRLVAIGTRGRVPGGRILALAFAIGSLCIACVFVLGWT